VRPRLDALSGRLDRLARARRRPRPLADRYRGPLAPAPFVDRLSDDDLATLNRLLPWQAFTADAHGRGFGGTAWSGKRVDPQALPDPRIERFHERFDLTGRHVLEVGCFEGIHTIALCRLAGRVTAIDARIENVVKTLVRCGMYDVQPRVFTYDVESSGDGLEDMLRADLCHHVGVLYHLADPIAHLRRLGNWTRRGVMLDTHVAAPTDALDDYEVDGRRFRYRRFRESGREDVFSGMREHSKWLLLDDLVEALRTVARFDRVDVVEERAERNGPRVLIFAERRARA
jgi:tRNA (mo5U34)-methyltransferase